MENAIKTDNAIKQALAVFLAPIAILGLVFSISTTSFTASANADGTSQQGISGDVDLSVQNTSIEMEVRPWCGWTALAADSDVITLAPTTADVVYDGSEIELVATGVLFAIKVGPAVGDTAVPQPFTADVVDNCSWFADNQKNGVAVSTTLSGNVFAAVSDANLNSTADDTMNFSAEAGNELTIDNNPTVGSCPVDGTGFSFIGSPFVVNDISPLTQNVVSMTAANTTTNNFCSWTSDYAISIPAGKKPLFGDSTYTYTGPTITNTMVYTRTP